MADNILQNSIPTGKWILIANQPNKRAYGPFDTMADASQWLADRVGEHPEFNQIYTEIVPFSHPKI